MGRDRRNAQVVDFYRQWSMRYENELLKVEGRVLPTEKVTQGQQQVCSVRLCV